MTRHKRIALWVAGIICGVGLAASGVVLVARDLDRADKVASVVGAAAGLLGLALAVYSVVQARQAAASAPSVQMSGGAYFAGPVSAGRDVIGEVRGDHITGADTDQPERP